ncbi:MAG: hypothetical protein PF503_00040 [Desulfobacula sp.]|jgi:hypothetical protein|nr:hypothetical protein [Desulfobacula sp.]
MPAFAGKALVQELNGIDPLLYAAKKAIGPRQLTKEEDYNRFKELGWGLRAWDQWEFNACDKRFGDEWPRTPALPWVAGAGPLIWRTGQRHVLRSSPTHGYTHQTKNSPGR